MFSSAITVTPASTATSITPTTPATPAPHPSCTLCTSLTSPEHILATLHKLPSQAIPDTGDDLVSLSATLSKHLRDPKHPAHQPTEALSALLAQLSAALLLEAFEGTLTSNVHPQAFTPREGSDPRQAIDELVDIHAASAGSSLLFTFAPPDWGAITPRLSDLLPLQDRCVHLDALIQNALIQNALPIRDVLSIHYAPTDNHALSGTTARAQTFHRLRALIVDNLLAPMDHALADLGLAYARTSAAFLFFPARSPALPQKMLTPSFNPTFLPSPAVLARTRQVTPIRSCMSAATGQESALPRAA